MVYQPIHYHTKPNDEKKQKKTKNKTKQNQDTMDPLKFSTSTIAHACHCTLAKSWLN